MSDGTVRKHLPPMGLYAGKGNGVNIRHDSPKTVEYRHQYVARRLANLNANGRPKVPEAFLDESYRHVDHSRQLTWLPRGPTVKDNGRKPMMVIFGAFIVFAQGNCFCAEIVRKSLLTWPVHGGSRGQPKQGRGRRAMDSEEWKQMPEVVRASRITPDLHDYQGNFNADLFEKIFKKPLRHAEGKLR